ncbi:MAG: hypothetical protein NVS3B20_24510 [Polyangiales bacterium]
MHVRCAAQKMRAYFQEIDADGETRSGGRVDAAKSTLDGCSVTPANRATAALYTYTPHVGAYGIGCGSSAGGSSLVAIEYDIFAAQFGSNQRNRSASRQNSRRNAQTPRR